MIARIWHGTTHTAKADDYLALLRRRAMADYSATPGNLAAHLLRREEGAITHFLTLTHWVCVQAIETFAGEDSTRAKYYAEECRLPARPLAERAALRDRRYRTQRLTAPCTYRCMP